MALSDKQLQALYCLLRSCQGIRHFVYESMLTNRYPLGPYSYTYDVKRSSGQSDVWQFL